jgi:formylglycine-generating enzyme required for sulfatase activity
MAFGEAETIKNSLDMSFVLIPSGEFIMGEREGVTKAADEDEFPRRTVVITRPFYIGINEVTQNEWLRVMGYNNSFFKGPERPVEMVSWLEAELFVYKLNQLEGVNLYRLPTEAEWEYATRAGTETFFWYGEHPGFLGNYAWMEKNSGGGTHPVRQKDRSVWGLYDIYGNVAEWTSDWYGKNYYKNSPQNDPQGPPGGEAKVIRGCSWSDPPKNCRSAYRGFLAAEDRNSYVGFRVVRIVERRPQ